MADKKRVIDASEVLGTLADIMRELPTPKDHYDNGYYSGLDRAFELIEQAPTVGQWIPVSEQLPEGREDVLVVAFWHEKWNVLMGWYAPAGAVWHIGSMEETSFPVSHWMPLPEPPKEG